MNKFSIPCDHLTGKEPNIDVLVPDYHPLTKAEIKQLLDTAMIQSESSVLSDILHRLSQAIINIVCPRPITGRVAEQVLKTERLFLSRYTEGGTPEMVETFYAILNWK